VHCSSNTCCIEGAPLFDEQCADGSHGAPSAAKKSGLSAHLNHSGSASKSVGAKFWQVAWADGWEGGNCGGTGSARASCTLTFGSTGNENELVCDDCAGRCVGGALLASMQGEECAFPHVPQRGGRFNFRGQSFCRCVPPLHLTQLLPGLEDG